jgi:hypothetical protein
VIGWRSIYLVWWNDIFSIERNDEVSGWRWFVDNNSKKIGNENKTILHELRLCGEMVNERFRRMISLTMEKNIF